MTVSCTAKFLGEVLLLPQELKLHKGLQLVAREFPLRHDFREKLDAGPFSRSGLLRAPAIDFLPAIILDYGAVGAAYTA